MKWRFSKIDWNGCPPLPWHRRRLRRRLRWVLYYFPKVYVTATTNGTHSAGSWHYSAHAVDLGSSDPQNRPEKKAQRGLHEKFGNNFKELFGPGAFYVKDGAYVSAHFPDHGDHTHFTDGA
jgi:hypothetical protein